jgi:hypothetical protein
MANPDRPRGSWWIVLTAVLLTALMGLVTIRIESAYLNNYPLFYDPVLYSLENARLYVQMADEGRLSLAAREWLGNERNPLRTVPLILFAPSLLAHPLGHMGSSLPALFVFLALLGWTVARRGGSPFYAVACMMLFCAIPGFFDPTLGLAANWLDLPAALLIGGGSLCLLNSDGARSWRWLAAFAALMSAAALSRYVAAAFAFVAGGPVLFFYLFQRWREEPRRLNTVLLPLVVVTLVVGVLAGPMLVAHLGSNAFYYSGLAYGLGRKGSAHFLRQFLLNYVDPGPTALRVLGCVALIALVVAHASARGQRGNQQWSSMLVSAWLAGGIPLFLIVVLRTAADPSPALCVLPGVFIALITPTRAEGPFETRRLTGLSGPLAVVALVIGVHAARSCWREATDPASDQRLFWDWVTHATPDVREHKAFDVALAGELSRQGRGLVWSPFFDETGPIHSMEAFYRFGNLILPAGSRYFSIHEAYWRAFYPGLSPSEIGERVYAAATRWVDVVVVADNPTRADAVFSRVDRHADNPCSRFVARYVAGRVAFDPQWRRVFRVESRDYGAVSGYRNLEAHGRGYRSALRSQSLVVSPIDP